MDAANFGMDAGIGLHAVSAITIIAALVAIVVLWIVFSKEGLLYRFGQVSGAVLIFGLAFVVMFVITGVTSFSLGGALVVALVGGRYAQRRFWA